MAVPRQLDIFCIRKRKYQLIWRQISSILRKSTIIVLLHEFHETCHSVTFIVLVNSHQRWKQTRNRVCFHLWCELTLALWCHSIGWSIFSSNKIKRNDKFHGTYVWHTVCISRCGYIPDIHPWILGIPPLNMIHGLFIQLFLWMPA